MDTLTPRELQVLQLICEGHSSRAIAARLGVSLKTVACHRYHILAKAGVTNSVRLLRWAMRQGLVTVELPQGRAPARIAASCTEIYTSAASPRNDPRTTRPAEQQGTAQGHQ